MAKKFRINRSDTYISPLVFIELFDDTRKEVGEKLILTSRKYKVLREAWIASIFSITLSMGATKNMGMDAVWWLRPNPEDVAPDFFAFNTKDIEGKDYKEGVNARWEVFEWGERSKYPLSDAVIRKVNRLHDDKMLVIGYISKANEPINLGEIHKLLAAQKPDILEVWLLTKIQELGNALILAQVYPYAYAVPVPTTIPAYFKEPYAFISKFRGKGNRSGGIVSINDQMEIRIVEENTVDEEMRRRSLV